MPRCAAGLSCTSKKPAPERISINKLTKLRNNTVNLSAIAEDDPAHRQFKTNEKGFGWIQTNHSSIQSVIDDCHPDVRKFLDPFNVKSYKANADGLSIELIDGIRISIRTLTHTSKHYIITNKRKEVIMNTIGIHNTGKPSKLPHHEPALAASYVKKYLKSINWL